MYMVLFFFICILVIFYKIGEIDNEIGSLLGLATGILICAVALVFPGGYLRLGLYVLCGFGLLTVYKIVRSMGGKSKH